MTLRIFYFESDSADEAIKVAGAVLGRSLANPAAKPAAVIESAPSAAEVVALPSPARACKPSTKDSAQGLGTVAVERKPATRTRTVFAGGPRDKAEAVLRKAGRPLRRAEVARQAGIRPGSTTSVFRDARFVVTPDGLLWLADQDDPRDEADESDDDEEAEDPAEVAPVEEHPTPQVAASAKRSNVGPVDAAELRKAIKLCGPMDCAEIARFTGSSHAACHRALQSPEFERDSDGLYWIAKPSRET